MTSEHHATDTPHHIGRNYQTVILLIKTTGYLPSRHARLPDHSVDRYLARRTHLKPHILTRDTTKLAKPSQCRHVGRPRHIHPGSTKPKAKPHSRQSGLALLIRNREPGITVAANGRRFLKLRYNRDLPHVHRPHPHQELGRIAEY